jgi:addiction module HigA family antidote
MADTVTEEKCSMTPTTYPAASLLDMKRITTHPGEILSEEFLKPLKLSATALAKEIGVPGKRLTEIIAKRRGMTADTALRLSRYFRTTPQYWMNLQSMYDLTEAVGKKRKIYAAISAHEAAQRRFPRARR